MLYPLGFLILAANMASKKIIIIINNNATATPAFNLLLKNYFSFSFYHSVSKLLVNFNDIIYTKHLTNLPFPPLPLEIDGNRLANKSIHSDLFQD